MRTRILRSPLLIILLQLLFNNHGYAIATVNPVIHEFSVSPENTDYLRASVFVKLSAKEFGTITGKRLNFPQRIYFKIVQRKLKRELKKDPDLLMTEYYDQKKAKFKFDALWFVIAAFIGPLGVLVSYTSPLRKGGPTKKDRITSAWLGFALFFFWFGFLFIF